MAAAWVALAQRGDPNAAVSWLAYDEQRGQHLEFGDSVHTGADARTEQLDFLDAYLHPG